VIDVFEPFEVGACDSTSIEEQVWADNNSLGEKVFLSGEGGRSIGTFSYDFALELVHIAFVNTLFNGSWNENIACLLHE
jgi:hypothetical protein